MADREIKDSEVHITMADTKPKNIEVEVEEITGYRPLFSGDQIAVTEQLKRWLYYHHGILIGAECGVLNCGGENGKYATTKNLWGKKKLNTMADKKIKDTEVQITMADTKPENIEVEVKEITEYRQLFPGNQIAVTGQMEGEIFCHHGIFISVDYAVVYPGGENKKEATVKNDHQTIFWGEKRLIIHDAESIDADTNGQEMTVERQEIHWSYNWSCHDTKLLKSALSFAYTVLPCAGGTDPGRSQREDQVHSQIYEASLKFVSKCPYPSEYMNKTFEKCVDVCGSYIQDGNCAFHCMRESSKTRLVEFCAKPKILFEFCPEYDPVDQTFQKDTASLCNSTFNRPYYESSDIYFCNPDNCLQLLESDVRSGATTLMTGTTEMNGGDIQEVWPLQIWPLILLLVVVVVVVLASFLACILHKRRHLRAKEKMTKNVETVMQKLVKG